MVVHKCAPFRFLVFISEGGGSRNPKRDFKGSAKTITAKRAKLFILIVAVNNFGFCGTNLVPLP